MKGDLKKQLHHFKFLLEPFLEKFNFHNFQSLNFFLIMNFLNA
jgi:hypothetical protein